MVVLVDVLVVDSLSKIKLNVTNMAGLDIWLTCVLAVQTNKGDYTTLPKIPKIASAKTIPSQKTNLATRIHVIEFKRR